MSDSQRLAELRSAMSGRTHYEGRHEPSNEFLMRLLTAAEQRAEAAEQKLAAEQFLARDSMALIRAMCESDDPIDLLADFTAHAGLRQPKAEQRASQLEADNARLREALTEIAHEPVRQCNGYLRCTGRFTSARLVDIARAALSPATTTER